MQIRQLAATVVLGAMTMFDVSHASPPDQYRWKNRVLVVIAPAGNAAAKAQRVIFEAAAEGMSKRQIVLSEALDDSERSREIRSRLSADVKRFRVFLIGKDGHSAASSDKPFSADELFARVDAMPMRRDEMRRGR